MLGTHGEHCHRERYVCHGGPGRGAWSIVPPLRRHERGWRRFAMRVGYDVIEKVQSVVLAASFSTVFVSAIVEACILCS